MTNPQRFDQFRVLRARKAISSLASISNDTIIVPKVEPANEGGQGYPRRSSKRRYREGTEESKDEGRVHQGGEAQAQSEFGEEERISNGTSLRKIKMREGVGHVEITRGGGETRT